MLPGASEHPRVASPCIGLDAGTRAAWALRTDWQPVAVYDKEPALYPALDVLHSTMPEGERHLGVLAGDITRFGSEEATKP